MGLLHLGVDGFLYFGEVWFLLILVRVSLLNLGEGWDFLWVGLLHLGEAWVFFILVWMGFCILVSVGSC